MAFTTLCQEAWSDEIVGAKGFVRFVDHEPVIFNQAAGTIDLEILEPLTSDDTSEGEIDAIETIEIVLIGRHLPQAAIRTRLDTCQVVDVPATA